MSQSKSIHNLKINSSLYNFVNEEVLTDIDINQDLFWSNFSNLIHDLGPKNKDLLDERLSIQNEIDRWHKKNLGKEIDINEYKIWMYIITKFRTCLNESDRLAADMMIYRVFQGADRLFFNIVPQ